MGEQAEYLFEQGVDAHIEHLAGMCDGPCQECDEVAARREQWRKQKRRQRKRRQRKTQHRRTT